MTLEPPITQEDIDNSTLFRWGADGTARIRQHPIDKHTWIVCFSDGVERLCTAGHVPFGLSRIPEPAMESQVVDGCCQKHGSTWVTDGVCRLCRIHDGIAAGPDYYDGTGCMEAVERMGIAKDFYRGQVVKYIWRLGRKDGNGLDDALKARDYLNRLITLLGTG